MNENKIFQLVSIVFVSVAMLILSIKCNSAQAMKRRECEFSADSERVELAEKIAKKDECTCVKSTEVKDGDTEDDLVSVVAKGIVDDVGNVQGLEKVATDIVDEVEVLPEEQLQGKTKILEDSLEKAILKLKAQKNCLRLTRHTKIVDIKDEGYDVLCDIIDALQLQLETKEIKEVLFVCDFLDRVDTRSADTLIKLLDFFNKNENVFILLDNREISLSRFCSDTDDELIFKAIREKYATKDVNPIDEFKKSLPYATIINEYVVFIYGNVLSSSIDKCDFEGKTVDKIRRYRNCRRKRERGSEVYLSELLFRYMKITEPKIKKFPIIERDEDGFVLYTPFGPVYVELSENDDPIVSVENYVIEFEDGKPTVCIQDEAYSYIELEVYMDAYLDEYVLQVIYDYLSIRGNKLKMIEKPNFICDNPMLACFCGILVAAEPYRFGDGGKLSRASLRMIYALMNQRVEDPYSQIFVSAQVDSVRCLLKGEDIGEFQEEFDEGLVVFSHAKNTARKDEDSLYPIGGKQQQLNQINDTCDFETDDSYADNLVRMRCSDGYSSDTDC